VRALRLELQSFTLSFPGDFLRRHRWRAVAENCGTKTQGSAGWRAMLPRIDEAERGLDQAVD